MIGKALDDYIKEYSHGGTTPIFKGVKSFLDLYKRGRLIPDTVIRIRDYGRVIDQHYRLAEEGLLELITEESKRLTPKEALNKNSAPDGWEVEGRI